MDVRVTVSRTGGGTDVRGERPSGAAVRGCLEGAVISGGKGFFEVLVWGVGWGMMKSGVQTHRQRGE